MSLRFGKTEVQQMVDVLDADFDSFTQAAEAALAEAEGVFEKRANFVVVGQLAGTRERSEIPPSDPEAIKVSLGWFSTEGDAIKAAESLWSSTASGDRYRVWVLPVFHGTPAELHAKAKERYAAAEQARAEKAAGKFKELVRKRQEAMEERARGGKGSCESCAHQPYDHGTDGSSRGKCLPTACRCERWIEKKK